jgi:hypothetical protein
MRDDTPARQSPILALIEDRRLPRGNPTRMLPRMLWQHSVCYVDGCCKVWGVILHLSWGNLSSPSSRWTHAIFLSSFVASLATGNKVLGSYVVVSQDTVTAIIGDRRSATVCSRAGYLGSHSLHIDQCCDKCGNDWLARQGTITAIAEDQKSFTVRIHAGYPGSPGHAPVHTTSRGRMIILFDPVTRLPKTSVMADMYEHGFDPVPEEEGTYVIQVKDPLRG